MKRLIVILLLLALLLTGCSPTEPDRTEDDDRAGAAEDAGRDNAEDKDAPDDSDHAEAPDASEQPDETPEQTPPPDDGAQDDDGDGAADEDVPAPGSTTAGGVTVHTDYSKYEPFAAPENVYTRLSDEPIADLQPSDDYGMLYPFRGSTFFSGYNGYYYEAGGLFGLVDAHGRIVADPTYTEIEPVSYYDMSTYEMVTLPMLRLTRTGEATVVEEDGWSYVDGEQLCGLATPDGSFVLPCEYGYISGMECGVLVMDEYAADAFTLYDFEGNVLLTERDLAIDGHGVEDYSYSGMLCSEGYLTINLSDGSWVMDLEGNLLHGPYPSLRTYSGGLAAASSDLERYGFVDYDGNWVIEPVYTWAYATGDGRFIATDENGMLRVFNSAGEEIFSVKADYGSATAYGYVVGSYSSSFQAYYDMDGELLLQSSSGDWWEVGGSGVFVRETQTGIELRNILTGATAAFEGDCTAGTIYTAADMDFTPLDTPYLYVTCYDENGGGTVLRVDDLSPVMALPTGGGAYLRGVIDAATGVEYLLVCNYDAGRYTLCDTELNELGTWSSQPTVYHGMVQITDDWSCSWQTLGGEVFFRYSLVASIGD